MDKATEGLFGQDTEKGLQTIALLSQLLPTVSVGTPQFGQQSQAAALQSRAQFGNLVGNMAQRRQEQEAAKGMAELRGLQSQKLAQELRSLLQRREDAQKLFPPIEPSPEDRPQNPSAGPAIKPPLTEAQERENVQRGQLRTAFEAGQDVSPIEERFRKEREAEVAESGKQLIENAINNQLQAGLITPDEYRSAIASVRTGDIPTARKIAGIEPFEPETEIGRLLTERQALIKKAATMEQLDDIDKQFRGAIEKATGSRVGDTWAVALQQVGIEPSREGIKSASKEDLDRAAEAFVRLGTTKTIQMEQVPAKTVQDMAENRATLDSIIRITDAFEAGGKHTTGPFQAFVFDTLRRFGLADQKSSDFRSSLALLATQLKHFFFGSAQSAQELKSALESLPNKNASDTELRSQLRASAAHARRMIERAERSLALYGFAVPPGIEELQVQEYLGQAKGRHQALQRLESLGMTRTEAALWLKDKFQKGLLPDTITLEGKQ